MCRRVSDTAAGEQSGIACTDAERRAALALAQDLRDQGREPRVQTLWVHVAWWAPQALAAALGVAASVASVGAVQLPPTLVLLGALLALLDQAVAEPAAEDDRGALAAALALAAELDAAPPGHLGVAIVLAGAGGAESAGLRAWLRGRRRR